MVDANGASQRQGTQCRRCGSFVSARFARVFGDNDNRVHGCHECMSTSQLFDGQPANTT